MRHRTLLLTFSLTTACAGMSKYSEALEKAKHEIAACDQRATELERVTSSDTTPAGAQITGAWRCSVEGSTAEILRVAQQGNDVTVLATNGADTWSLAGKLAGSTLRFPKNALELHLDGGDVGRRVLDGDRSVREPICER